MAGLLGAVLGQVHSRSGRRSGKSLCRQTDWQGAGQRKCTSRRRDQMSGVCVGDLWGEEAQPQAGSPGQTMGYAWVPVTGRGPGRAWGQVCFSTKIGTSATCPGSETQHGLQCEILALNYQIHTTQTKHGRLGCDGLSSSDSPPPGRGTVHSSSCLATQVL